LQCKGFHVDAIIDRFWRTPERLESDEILTLDLRKRTIGVGRIAFLSGF